MSHVERALKIFRPVINDKALWNREWENIDFFCGQLGKYLEPGARFLDVGCGGKELEVGARERGLVYQGLDIEDGNFDYEPFPVTSESVDLLVGLAIIEHLQDPGNFMEESLRVLRPGGVLILSTPNWRYSSKTFFDNPGHVRPYSHKSMRILGEAYGLEKLHVVPGLRAKPKWMYFHPFSFEIARLLPFRGRPRFIPSVLAGRATSVILVAQKPRKLGPGMP